MEEVWAALDRPQTWESIWGVDRVYDPKIDDQGRLQGFSFETMAGGRRHVGFATPHERIEKTKMAWKIENSEIQGMASVGLTPSGAGTTITVTLEVESVGFLSTLLFPAIAGAIGGGLPQAVDEFAAGFDR